MDLALNPFDLDATGLMIWGLVAHLVADWVFQNHWMAVNKTKRRDRRVVAYSDHSPGQFMYVEAKWWDRHPAAYVHAGIHGIFLCLVFGWVTIPLAIVHLIIDTRWPLEKWSKFIDQTEPEIPPPLVDVGTMVRFWTDQVFHISSIAVAALIVGNV